MESIRRQVATTAHTAENGERVRFARATPPGDSGAARCPVVAEAERARRSARGAQTGASLDKITTSASSTSRRKESAWERLSVPQVRWRPQLGRSRAPGNDAFRGIGFRETRAAQESERIARGHVRFDADGRLLTGHASSWRRHNGITGRQSPRGRWMSGPRNPSLARRRCHRTMRTY